jgi:two-component system cell cycle response regulator CpdR
MAKIILAEDDDDMRRFLVKALEKAGHHVTAFAEGLAFEEIKQAPSICCSPTRDGMDGIELRGAPPISIRI